MATAYQAPVMRTFPPPDANIPVVQRPDPLVGGGTPVAPVALDPRGLVPVNRTQPVATDNMEPQRLMERRLGTMPPSSFSGAGAGFVPVDRPMTGVPIFNPAVGLTDSDRVHPIGQPQALSGPAVAAIARQQMYDRRPVSEAMTALRARLDEKRANRRTARRERIDARMAQDPAFASRIENLRAAFAARDPRRIFGLLGQ